VVIGSRSFDVPVDESGPVFRLEGSAPEILLQILARNLSAALLLFSGYVTLGVTSVLALGLISIFVGASGTAMLSAGAASTIGPWVVMYIAIEFTGLLVAGVAGLLPLAVFLARSFGTPDIAPGRSTRHSLRLLALAVTLIIASAVIETVVIVTHQ
jgi:uncharacterized membrane protein SpoIIM required for sporulation